MRFARERAVQALARMRIDRDHARAENEPAGADGRRLEVAVVSPQIESGQRCSDQFAHNGQITIPNKETDMAGNAEMIIELDKKRMTAMAQKDVAALKGMLCKG